MANILTNFRQKRAFDRATKNALLVSKIFITHDGEMRISFSPDGTPTLLAVALIILQASNIGWNLTGTDLSDIFRKYVFPQIVENWPDRRLRNTGEFLDSLSFFIEAREQIDSGDGNWAVQSGERFEQRLVTSSDGSFYVYDFYPGMPGFGKDGLVINMIMHYVILLDYLLTQLSDEQIAVTGKALGELWIKFMNPLYGQDGFHDKFKLVKDANEIIQAFEKIE